MAFKKKIRKKSSKRFDSKTYRVYGLDPLGNHYLNLAMRNDYKLTQYVSKNSTRLSKMSKDAAIRDIKSHASESWAIKDLKSVKSSNVHSGILKRDLKYFND